jgi:hypothetical protein
MTTMTKNILVGEWRRIKDIDAETPSVLRKVARSLDNALTKEYRSRIALIPVDDPDKARKIYRIKANAVMAYRKDVDASTGKYTAKQVRKCHMDRIRGILDVAHKYNNLPESSTVGVGIRPANTAEKNAELEKIEKSNAIRT